jgi:4-diphosphocytidyl-2-C-methyl-D-erythritol kinase
MPRATSVIVDAPAKINLGLHVVRKRPDGYHDIETVFVPLDWSDTITLAPESYISMSSTDPTLPVDGRNLCMRAAEGLQAVTGFEGGARMHREKKLPWAAGLGSGSSDAAATIKGLCELWDVAPEGGELHRLACDLGADVPFFLELKPALGSGRGDELVPMTGGDRTPFHLPYAIAVASPEISISTSEAYAGVTPAENRRVDLVDLLTTGTAADWRKHLVNDFEPSVFRRYPRLAELKEEFYRVGAVYASMSGSGSSIFGLFEEAPEAENALATMQVRGWCGRALL